jgi:hypothetical protein
MSTVSEKLLKLLHTLPAILLTTFTNVFITTATAGVVMIQLLANWSLCQRHHWVALGLAILTAIGVYSWIVFNHKLREYIKARSQNE